MFLHQFRYPSDDKDERQAKARQVQISFSLILPLFSIVIMVAKVVRDILLVLDEEQQEGQTVKQC